MEKEEILNPQQSLELITAVINQTKENLRQHSFIFLLWGWLMAIASFSRFLFQVLTDLPFYFIPFPIAALIGIVISVLYYRKKSITQTETYLNSFIKNLWIGLGIGYVTIVFVSLTQKTEPFHYTLILAAIGTMVTGLSMRFRPLIVGSIFFLLAALICVFLPSEYKVLVNGIAIIVGFLIPGYLLKQVKA